MEKKEEKLTFSDKLGKWIYKNRKLLISLIVILLIGGIAIAFGTSSIKKNIEKNFSQLNNLVDEYSMLTRDFDKTEDEKLAESKVIAEEMIALAEANKKNGVALRAYMNAAEIYYGNGDFALAAECWENAAKVNEKAYTAGISLYNASVCYEELGNIDAAIAALEKAAANENFPLATKAMFNQGRLEEAKSNYDAAYDIYNALVAKNASDEWAKLAKTRAIYLEEENLINQ